MAKHATIRLKGLKVLQADPGRAVPVDLVPADGPAGNPTLTLELEGVGPVCTAVLNGKSYRRMLKALAERGPEGVDDPAPGDAAAWPRWAAGARGRGHLGRAPVAGGAGRRRDRRRWRLTSSSRGRDRRPAGAVPPAWPSRTAPGPRHRPQGGQDDKIPVLHVGRATTGRAGAFWGLQGPRSTPAVRVPATTFSPRHVSLLVVVPSSIGVAPTDRRGGRAGVVADAYVVAGDFL